ncbi:Six-hairpin glycosidase [Penicillium canariense]|uniref:Six-hairpin glycosidase n=1 Tax=Penicillium canariense TaxID=189055 RepID=A0A9W9ID95_9EURO|nr:Six-hairpin glycosidase [Penicillium canariense]KAJ5174277.1 Six-hairpin glycosidase [Penicillium canariense]
MLLDEFAMEPQSNGVKAHDQHDTGISHDVSSTQGSPNALSARVMEALYSESVMAKVWRIAAKAMGNTNPPVLYPEYTGKDGATYVYRSLDFWTSGFFPGSLYLLLERIIRYPHISLSKSADDDPPTRPHKLQLEYLCRWWTVNLHQNALKRDTHDLGFMIAPWAMKSWDLHRDPAAYSSLIMAAHSLASRFSSTTQCLRSWDTCITKRYSFTDPSMDFLFIIDNMLNLDLLFWAAKETENPELYRIALAHARTSRIHHIREDNSTFHVVNLDPETGDVKAKFTNQGYSDESCWARGQAWGILGFMQTFQWTGKIEFLDTAKALADYFIAHLPADGVPYWDLTAPIIETSPRDTSAAMIAACGMLLLYKALKPSCEADRFLREAMNLVDATVGKFVDVPTLHFQSTRPQSQCDVFRDGCVEYSDDAFDTLTVVDRIDLKLRDTIVHGATINNYEFAPRRWANHGLVYADYYFLLFGNMLLELGLVGVADCNIGRL